MELDELRRAVEEDRLALLPVERLLTSEAQYSARQISEQTGLDLDFFQAQRRALGLAVPGPDERVYGQRELDSARLGNQYRQAGLPDEEALEAQRVLGRGMARYVDAVTSLVAQSVLEGGTDENELAARLEAISKTLLPLAGPWLEHVFALHLREALRQEAVTAEQMASGRLDAGRDTAVAFADLVGFTELGETIPVEELGSVAGRLSRLAEDAVGSAGEDRQGDRRRGHARLTRAGAAGRRGADARGRLGRREGCRRSGPASPSGRPSTAGATGTARRSTWPAG